MGQEISNVFVARDFAVIDVGYTLDGDLGGTVPHGITGGLFGGAGAIPSVWTGQPASPATAAARRLADIIVASVDAANIILDKVNAGGSGTATGNRHVRLYAVRSARQLSAQRTALIGAVGGAMLAGGLAG